MCGGFADIYGRQEVTNKFMDEGDASRCVVERHSIIRTSAAALGSEDC